MGTAFRWNTLSRAARFGEANHLVELLRDGDQSTATRTTRPPNPVKISHGIVPAHRANS